VGLGTSPQLDGVKARSVVRTMRPCLDLYGTPGRASGLLLWPVVSSASQKRLARLGMVAPSLGT
jgi:hypothetical protein